MGGRAEIGAGDVEDVSVAGTPVRLPAGGAVNGRSQGGHVAALTPWSVRRSFERSVYGNGMRSRVSTFSACPSSSVTS